MSGPVIPQTPVPRIPRRRIAALGGGTGLAALLRGLKQSAGHLTAIVTVGDDGGSSGRLREELGMLPPGDIRNCLVALADDESLMGRLFQYRFRDGDLSGHSFGNLFLAAMTEVAGGFDTAIEESSQVLKIGGRVMPSTLEAVSLWAEKADGERVSGETSISAGDGACRRMWLEPMSPAAHEPAVDAIATADLVVLGPGSLFTSVLPHLAVPGLARAVVESPARRVYICNVMTQPGETTGFDAADHVAAILAAAPGALDAVVVHDGDLPREAIERYAREGQEPVTVDRTRLEALGVEVIAADIAQRGSEVRHAPVALAKVLLSAG